MNLRMIQKELARNLEGLGFTVYSDALKAAGSARLPAIVIGVPEDITLQTVTRALVSLPVHVLLSTADTEDALQKLSDGLEFGGGVSVLDALMSATSVYWTSVDVQSVTGFTLVSLGANQSALGADINVVVNSVQV